MKARITAYRELLVLESLVDKSEDGVCALSTDHPNNIGQIFMDTAKHVGISEEAVKLMKLIPRSRDCIGDLDFSKNDDGTYAVGWLGPLCRLLKPTAAEGSRNYEAPSPGTYISIPNDVPEAARLAIDKALQK